MVALTVGSAELHQRFLAILPRIERHARIYFRHLKCHVKKEEAVAETIALAWRWFVRLVRRGKDVSGFVSTLASFAAKAVRSGRRVGGMEKGKDVLSPRAQARHGFTVSKLPDFSTLETNPLNEALQDNRRSPVPDQPWARVTGRRCLEHKSRQEGPRCGTCGLRLGRGVTKDPTGGARQV